MEIVTNPVKAEWEKKLKKKQQTRYEININVLHRDLGITSFQAKK